MQKGHIRPKNLICPMLYTAVMKYARCKGGFYKCALSDFEIVFEDKFLAAHDGGQLSLIVNIIHPKLLYVTPAQAAQAREQENALHLRMAARRRKQLQQLAARQNFLRTVVVVMKPDGESGIGRQPTLIHKAVEILPPLLEIKPPLTLSASSRSNGSPPSCSSRFRLTEICPHS